MMKVLEEIKKILEQEEFECTLLAEDRLLVFLGLDAKKRERSLELVVSQPIKPSKQSSSFYRLEFRTSLPFKAQDFALNQVASLLLFLNQLIDLPGFELDELEGQITYRYVWIMQPDFIDHLLIMAIMRAIQLNIELFAEPIESLAHGQLTFNDLLEQITQILESAEEKQ